MNEVTKVIHLSCTDYHATHAVVHRHTNSSLNVVLRPYMCTVNTKRFKFKFQYRAKCFYLGKSVHLDKMPKKNVLVDYL